MVAKSSASEETITSDDLPCTVKLVRGESYNFKGRMYLKGEERAVTREVAIYLADQVVVRKDRDGESMEKPVFKVTGLDADEDDENDVRPRGKLAAKKKPSRSRLAA